jgi:hypothetical protein
MSKPKVYLVMVDHKGAHESATVSSVWTTQAGALAECHRLMALRDSGWDGHGVSVLEVGLDVPCGPEVVLDDGVAIGHINWEAYRATMIAMGVWHV